MSMYQVRKHSFLDVSRNQSTPTTSSLNTTDISLNNTNLENYKKALNSIVKRLNKTPSASSKTSLKRSESKLNQTQQPTYNSNTTFLNTSNSSKKYHIANASTYVSKNQPSSKRSHSNEGNYLNSKELLNKSMQEPYIRKGSFSSNIAKSISINKLDKGENQEQEDTGDREPPSVEGHYRKNSALNSTILQDVDFHNLDGEGDKKLRDLVHQYQLRDAIHRQEISKLKSTNESLRNHAYELEKELDRSRKSKDSERRYINRLEAELNQIKERVKLEAEKKSLVSTLSDQKENQYVKMIEDLKSQLSSISSEKKLTEHLLKNALTQHDTNKSDKSQPTSSGTHKGLDTSILAATAGKYSTSAAGRPKADAFARKTSAIKIFNDENEYASYSQCHSGNTSFVMNSVKTSKDLETVSIKESKQATPVLTAGNMGRILQEGSMNSAVELPTEGDEVFPNKVCHPQLNQKSLKERIDMNQFKLDLSIISKNRKVG